jgi:hypothetical protein
MPSYKLICAIGMAGSFVMICGGTEAADLVKYPEWKGA